MPIRRLLLLALLLAPALPSIVSAQITTVDTVRVHYAGGGDVTGVYVRADSEALWLHVVGAGIGVVATFVVATFSAAVLHESWERVVFPLSTTP